MKVGIITITHNENYGNRLQNYAVQEVLVSLGCEVETIKNETATKEKTIKLLIKSILVNAYNISRIKKIGFLNHLVRLKIFKKFTENYINQSKYVISKDNIPEELKNQYDYFVCGSDQIWNPEFPFNSEIDFLTFADKKQRISFSASFGISKLPEKYIEQYKIWIEGMNHLSVREEAGAKIIKEITGRESEVLIDPTLMLDKDKWLTIAKKPNWYKGDKYILTYFLGEKGNGIEEEIKEIANNNSLSIINLLDIIDKDVYSVDPSEFIWLINNCNLMCTDSFHGVVFSLIMKSPFIIYDRKSKFTSMNSRIDTLLSLFNMDERRSTKIEKEKIFDIDFSNVDLIINNERQRVYQYLKNALNLK